MKKNQIIIAVIVLVLVAGISFYAGTKVNSNPSSSRQMGQFGQDANGIGGPGNNIRTNRGGMMGGAVSGEVLSKDATSITVKLRDGGSKIIFITSGTAVQKTSAGTIEDVVVGSQISATGQANADGSINATSINQRPNVPVQSAGAGAGAPQGGAQQAR
ncbi:MAG: hypothetical protein WCQ00_02560 [bacterium]